MSIIKLAVVTPGSFPIPSAKSSSVERVVEKCIPLLDSSIEPRIYGRTSKRLRRIGQIGGVPCYRFPAASQARYSRLVAQSVGKFNPDVISIENRPRRVLRFKDRFPAKEVWLSLHSTTFMGARHIAPVQLRRAFFSADRIIVNSEHIKQEVMIRAPEVEDKIAVVHLGVDTQRFASRFTIEGAAMRNAWRMQKGLNNRKVVLFMGRLLPMKGVHHLLDILPDLVAGDPDVLLVVVGSAYYGSHRKTTYTNKLHRLGRRLSRHVRFVPYVSYKDVPEWMLAADVVAVPSSSKEAFGLVVVEAMASGAPVVATRSGGIKEIVEEGETGYLVDQEQIKLELRHRIADLLASSRLRASMGEAARLRVEQHFTWQHTANAWSRLLLKQQNEGN